MNVSDSDIKDVLLNPTLNGSKSHYISDCPFCGKKQHLYVQRSTSKVGEHGNLSWMWECKKCGNAGRLHRLLKQLDRLDLLEFARSVSYSQQLTSIVEHKELTPDSGVATQVRPVGFKRLWNHSYLNGRGFEHWQYSYYEVGLTKHPSLKDYLVFIVLEQGQCKGYVARCLLSSNQLDQYNVYAKQQGLMKKLRYINSTNTDFSKLLFGIDEVCDDTKTVILVEGIFDKTNVDRILRLHLQTQVKCLATFGKKISSMQISKIQQKGITDVILMFDPDALNDSKRDIYKLDKVFNVKAVYLREKDPGDLSAHELHRALQQRMSPLNFYLNNISNNLK